MASLQQVERPNVTLKDFELLKVIGKGSFAKVSGSERVCLCVSVGSWV